MAYEIFEKDARFSENEINANLKKIVQKSLSHVINECSKSADNYNYAKEKYFIGLDGMERLLDDELLKSALLTQIQDSANQFSVKRPLNVTATSTEKDYYYGEAYNKEDEKIVENNVLAMKDQILKIYSEIKDDEIMKFDLVEKKNPNNNTEYEGGVISKIKNCVKDHDYKVLTAKDKVKSKIQYLTGEYPEKQIKEFIKGIYKKDLEDQVKCIDSMYPNKINSYKNAVHDDFKELLNHLADDLHGQAHIYGLELDKVGKNKLAIKKDFVDQVSNNFDVNFEIFYASVSKYVSSHIQNASKIGIFDKIKNATFPSNNDIETVINTNERLNIQNTVVKKNKNNLTI